LLINIVFGIELTVYCMCCIC